MYDKHERSNAHEIDDVGERQQRDGRHVMEKHLPEILRRRSANEMACVSYLSFDVDELREEQRPVEAQFDHVVPEHVACQRVIRMVGPAVSRVSHPGFLSTTNKRSIRQTGSPRRVFCALHFAE